MKSFRPFSQPFRHILLERTLMAVMVGGLAASLAGCGRPADSEPSASSPATKPASKASGAQNGIALKSDGLAIDAQTATALLGGYSTQPLSFQIMSGWVDKEKIRLANQETDKAEKRKKAMGTFGTLTVQVAAAKAEPGTYQLTPKEGAPQTGKVTINQAKDAGIAAAYTSQSGTLTIKSVSINDAGKVAAVEGAFEGQFKSHKGDSRAFSGSFLVAPKD